MEEQIFLAGSFDDKNDKKVLKRIKGIIESQGYYVWWAPDHVKPGYGSDDTESKLKVRKLELDEISKSKALVAVIKEITCGTWTEVDRAHFDFGVPTIVYEMAELKAFRSGNYTLAVDYRVKNDEELVNVLKDL